MRTILVIFAALIIGGGVTVWKAMQVPSRFGTFSGAPKTEVAEVLKAPAAYANKSVLLEGVVREQCQTMGCFFYFLSGTQKLRVDLQDIAMTAPRKAGHTARVEGRTVPFGDGYQFWAAAVEFE